MSECSAPVSELMNFSAERSSIEFFDEDHLIVLLLLSPTGFVAQQAESCRRDHGFKARSSKDLVSLFATARDYVTILGRVC